MYFSNKLNIAIYKSLMFDVKQMFNGKQMFDELTTQMDTLVITFKIDIFQCYGHVELCTKIARASFYLTVLLIDLFLTYAASSDEMNLWSSLDNSSQL